MENSRQTINKIPVKGMNINKKNCCDYCFLFRPVDDVSCVQLDMQIPVNYQSKYCKIVSCFINNHAKKTNLY